MQGQEGISNLVDAFLVAGSKSVVASLWSADDTSASALMERSYQRLAQGENTSSALRNAKLDLLGEIRRSVKSVLLGGVYQRWRDFNSDWNRTAMNLTLDERTKIFDKVCRLVATKHFDPGINGVDWNA